MPFGLTNAPAMFQCLMESCLGDVYLNWCIIYLYDIIVFSKMPEDHIKRLRKCMSLRPNDLVLVHVKAPTGDHMIADQWEATPHSVLSQLAKQPVFKVQPIDAEDDENICILHRNMLFPVQSVTHPIPKTDDKHLALVKANLLVDLYFDD